jgi:hypothetical protein
LDVRTTAFAGEECADEVLGDYENARPWSSEYNSDFASLGLVNELEFFDKRLYLAIIFPSRIGTWASRPCCSVRHVEN